MLWTGHANRGVCLGENRVRVVLGGHLQRGTRDVVVSVANNGSTLGSETDYGYNISLGQASQSQVADLSATQGTVQIAAPSVFGAIYA